MSIFEGVAEELDTVLVIKYLTYKQAMSLVNYIIRQQENDRFEFAQTQTANKSDLDDSLRGFSTLRVY